MMLNSEAFKGDFITECRELLDRAESVILTLEESVTPDCLNQLFRYIHTVKGNLSAYSGPGMIELLHELETLLNSYREGTNNPQDQDIDLILVSVDWIRQQLNEGLEGTASNEKLLSRLGRLNARGTATCDTEDPQKRNTGNHESKGRHSRARIRIPRRLLDSASRDSLEVLVATLDLSLQESGTLSEYVSLCKSLEYGSGQLIHRLRTDEISDLETSQNNGTEHSIPAYFLLTGVSIDEALLEKVGLRVDQKKVLKRPPGIGSSANRSGGAKGTPIPEIVVNPKEVPQQSDRFPDESIVNENSGAKRIENLRVPLRLIDNLIRLAGATVGARNELMQLIQSYEDPRLQLVGGRLGKMVTQMQEEIMLTRLQELQALFGRIPRVVRDVSKKTGKKVELEFSGAEVELDKNLIDAIGEAMFHLVRNSIDHGIESPAVRKQKGKPESGLLRIAAEVRNGSVVLAISDDGKGLDLPALRNAAVRLGIHSVSEVEALADEEVAELIFHPGLSTASHVTNTSGRGVGMDAVRETFKSAGGSISVSSVTDHGTRFLAILPQTLSIVTCLTVFVHGRCYAIPQAGVEEVVLFQSELLDAAGNASVYQLRGRLLPLIDLAVLLDSSQQSAAESYVVIVRTERQLYGIHVDSIGNTEEILVKPLGDHFRGNSLYSGAAVLGNGAVTPILDISGLARFAGVQFVLREDREQSVEKGSDREDLYILFDSAGQRFAIPAESSPRIEKYSRETCDRMLGFSIVKYSNRIVPILDLQSWLGIGAERNPEFLLILKKDGEYVAIASELIVGIQTSLPDVEACDLHESMAGQVIYNERTILVLNTSALFRWRQSRQRELQDRSQKFENLDSSKQLEELRS